MELNDSTVNKKKGAYILFLIVLSAFLLRFIAGMAVYSGSFTSFGFSDEYKKGFWGYGYLEYADFAINLVEGRGLYRVDRIFGEMWSHRPPAYPLILAGLYIVFGKSSLPPVIVQSIIGALTAIFTYLIARMIFSKEVGIIAALMTALYPYYIIHNTIVQDTTLFTFLTAVTIYFLLKTGKTKGLHDAFLAGIFLGFTALTRSAILVFLPIAVAWLIMILKDNRVKMISVLLTTFIVINLPWLIRNTMIYGKPVFAIQSGIILWAGNNPYVLAAGYPYECIDVTTIKAWAQVSDEQKRYIWSLSELEKDRFFTQKAIEFIRDNPKTALKGAVLKVYAVMSWKFSPANSGIKSIVYTATYLPLLVLGVIGAFISRDKWRELSMIYGLFFIFIITTAVYLGHTTHRIYLDIYLMILSSYTIIRIKDFVLHKYAEQFIK